MGLLARALGKWLGEKAGLATFGAVKRIPLKEKIADLAHDAGLCQSYLSDMIKAARGRKSLEAIKGYLESHRNDLPVEVTKKLLKAVEKKLAALHAQIGMNVDHHHIEHMVNAVTSLFT